MKSPDLLAKWNKALWRILREMEEENGEETAARDELETLLLLTCKEANRQFRREFRREFQRATLPGPGG